MYQWKPPPQHSIKVNVDGVVSLMYNKSTVGIVIKDSVGEVLVAQTLPLPQLLTPLNTEIITIKEALH